MTSELELEGYIGLHHNKREKEVLLVQRQQGWEEQGAFGEVQALTCNRYIGPWMREVRN